MIYTLNKVVKMGIYHNSKKKTLAEIKQELGADVVCNLNLFDMTKFTGNCFTKADGKIVGDDGASYPVLAWNTNDKVMKQGWSSSVTAYAHAFGCLDLVRDGRYMNYVPSWASGSRQRTAIGIKADGTPVIYCNQANITIKTVADALIKEGCVYAINVDGGGSTQCILPIGELHSSRIVHTVFWAILEKDTKTPTNTTTTKCPYSEPLLNIKQGSTGNGAKWVQWYLDALGYNIGSSGVDGIFGSESVKALKKFQKDWGFNGKDVDGICGSKTRKALKEAIKNPTKAATTTVAKTVKITASALNIRSGAGTSYGIVGVLKNGAEVEVIDEQNGWYKTPKGWISKQYAQEVKTENGAKISTNRQQKVAKMTVFAHEHLNCPYVYGSQGEVCTNALIDWSARLFPSYTTPTRANRIKQYIKKHQGIRAYDCSGFVLEALKTAEVDLPDTTAAGIYSTYCTPINKKDLQEGDLVFTSGLDHIGLVVEGGVVVEAAGSDIGVVKTSSVDDRKCKSIYYPDYGTQEYYTKGAWTKFGRLKCLED